jgi:hypothetical protein
MRTTEQNKAMLRQMAEYYKAGVNSIRHDKHRNRYSLVCFRAGVYKGSKFNIIRYVPGCQAEFICTDSGKDVVVDTVHVPAEKPAATPTKHKPKKQQAPRTWKEACDRILSILND